MPIKMADTQAGNTLVDVPEDQVQAALQSGRYRVLAQEKYHITDGDRVVAIPGINLGKALARGFDVATEQQVAEKKYGDAPIKAFAAGAARAVSFGLSDQIMTAMGVAPETLRGIQQANPAASGGGEVAGILGSMLVPGLGEATAARGAVGVAKVAQVAETAATMGGLAEGAMALDRVGMAAEALTASKSVLRGATTLPRMISEAGLSIGGGTRAAILKSATEAGLGKLAPVMARVGGMATGGAFEGALYGLGHGISEEALGDPAVAGQGLAGLASASYEGAKTGGIAGGLFGITAEVLTKPSRWATKTIVDGIHKAVDFAADASEHQVFSEFGLTPTMVSRIVAQRGRGEEVYQGFLDLSRTPGVVPASLRKGAEDAGELLTPGLVGKQRANISRLQKTSKFYGQVIGSIRENVGELVEKNAWPSGEAMAAMLKKEVDAEVGLSTESAAVKQRFDDTVDHLKTKMTGPRDLKTWSKWLQQMKAKGKFSRDDPSARVMQVAYQKANDFINGATEQLIATMSPEQSAALGQLMGELSPGKISTAADVSNVLQQAKDRYHVLISMVKESAKKEYVGGPSLGADALRYGMRSVIWNLPGSRNTMRVLGGAAKRVAFMAASGGVRSWGARVGTTAEAAAQLGKLSSSLEAVQARLNTAIVDVGARGRFVMRNLVPSVEVLAGLTGHDDPVTGALAANDEIQAMNQNPGRLADQLTASSAGMEGVAPNVGIQLATARARQINYLALQGSALLSPPSNLGPNARERGWQPSRAAAGEYAEHVAGVKDPVSTFEAVAAGTASPAQIKATRAVYPELSDRAAQQISMAIESGKVQPSEATLFKLGLLAGRPIGHSFQRDAVRRAQAVYAASVEGPPSGMPQGDTNVRQSGLNRLQPSKLATVAQQLTTLT